MWNMNDVYAAQERYDDIRRAAEKHNTVARIQAAGQGEQDKQQGAQPSNKIWERMRKALR